MEKKLTEYTAHDFAGIFTQDIKDYLDMGGSFGNLFATKVYSVLDGGKEEDDFSFARNTIEMAMRFRTEATTEFFIKRRIKLHEHGFSFRKDSLSEIRKQIAWDKEYGKWKTIKCIRYFALLSNINTISYRNVFATMDDVSKFTKETYMMIDLYKNDKNGVDLRNGGNINEHKNEN